MATLRNVADEPLELRCSGVSYGIVQPDELVDVPDKVYLDHVWPDAVWSEVEAPERPEPEPFNPADRTVGEVLAHLAEADDEERDRVLDLEREGKARKGVLGDEGEG